MINQHLGFSYCHPELVSGSRHYSDKHLFALYLPHFFQKIATCAVGSLFECVDEQVWRRIVHILRLKEEESVILFDEHYHATISIHAQTFTQKKKIYGIIRSYAKNQPLMPEIILYQAIPKKNVFEESVYTAAQMGVSIIVPVITNKVQRSWGGNKEKQRLATIAQAAAEQAKYFIPPNLSDPVSFQTFLDQEKSDATSVKLFFDADGEPFFTLMQQLMHKKSTIMKLKIFIGAEGGLTLQEKKLLVDQGFACHALTPTILRVHDAVIVGLGSLRSVLA